MAGDRHGIGPRGVGEGRICSTARSRKGSCGRADGTRKLRSACETDGEERDRLRQSSLRGAACGRRRKTNCGEKSLCSRGWSGDSGSQKVQHKVKRRVFTPQ
eukprot:6316930-Prymnesium_polylepis.1